MPSIEKVVIKIGDQEIPLSLEEAKELQAILNETFPKKEKEYIPYPSPIVINPWRPYYPFDTHVYWTCNTQQMESGTLYLSTTTH